MDEIISRKDALLNGLSFYFTGKPCIKGHIVDRYVVSGNCTQCNADAHKTRRIQKQNEIKHANKEWRTKNKEYIYNKNKEWKENNKDKVSLSAKKYHEKMKTVEWYIEKRKEYRENNKDKQRELEEKWNTNNRTLLLSRRKKWRDDKKSSDVVYRAITSIRSITIDAFRRRGLKKSKRTEEVLGCSVNDARLYLESKFKDGMSWLNHGEWHIDHIIPLASAKTVEDVMRLARYTNLQPLWKQENLKKGSMSF